MGSLTEERQGFELWSRNCAAQMLRRRSVETRAFETARSHIARVTQGRCQFFADRPKLLERFGYSEANLGTTKFQLLSWTSEKVECLTSTSRAQDLILYIPLEGSFEVRQGGRSTQINPGELFLVSASGQSTRRWQGSSILLNVIIPRKTIAGLLAADFDIACNEPFSLPPTANLSAVETQTFCKLLESLLFDLTCEHSTFAHPGASRHAESAFLHSLVRSLPNNYSKLVAIADSTHSVPPYMKRVEAFIKANVAQPLDMTQLVRVAGVSTRTLYYGFKTFRRTTPQRYVKQLRLKMAREAMFASHGREKISEIALRFGYGNAAQFSNDYRQLFGVSPSETLRISG
jgi:AraC-like DNA-binding protein